MTTATDEERIAPADRRRAGRRARITLAGVLAGVLAAVLAGCGVGAAASTPLTDTTPAQSPTASQAGSPATSASTKAATTQPVHDANAITGGAARQLLSASGLQVDGDPVAGWEWQDTNGHNVLLQTRTESSDGVWRTQTVRVYHAAGIGTRPRILRALNDSQRCDLDLYVGFTKDSVTISDLDHNGAAEATVGWSSSCRSDISAIPLTLAVLHDGRFDILRGRGQVRPGADVSYVDKATFTADPAPAAWPAGVYPATVALFHRLYV